MLDFVDWAAIVVAVEGYSYRYYYRHLRFGGSFHVLYHHDLHVLDLVRLYHQALFLLFDSLDRHLHLPSYPDPYNFLEGMALDRSVLDNTELRSVHAFAYLVASLQVALGKRHRELPPAVQAFAEDQLQIVEGIQGHEDQYPFHRRSTQRLEAYCKERTFDVVVVAAAAVLLVADLAAGLQVAAAVVAVVVISVVAVHLQDFGKIRLLAVMETYHHQKWYQDHY